MPSPKPLNPRVPRWQRTFPAAQRGAYLALQRDLEKTAVEISFLTPTLSNAITTVEVLEGVIFERLTEGLRKIIPVGRLNAVRDEVYDRMRQRHAQLTRRLAARQVHVRVLFLKDHLTRDLRAAADSALPRYRQLLKLAEQGVLSFRLIPRLNTSALEKAGGSFALIYNLRRGSAEADVAVASAAQATSPRLTGRQLIAQNTPEALSKVAQFERYWNAALGEAASRELVETEIGRSGSGSRR